jgi:hypothetical protein
MKQIDLNPLFAINNCFLDWTNDELPLRSTFNILKNHFLYVENISYTERKQ